MANLLWLIQLTPLSRVKPILHQFGVGNSHDVKPAASADRNFLGLIDELRIWNRALSQDEITREMQTGYKSRQNTKDTAEAQQASEEK